jgi:ornithine cyclodeaminase
VGGINVCGNFALNETYTMKVLIVSQSEIADLLPMPACMEVMAEALKALTLQDAQMPLRQVLRLPESRNVLAAMPSYFGSRNAMGVKVISVFPGNHGTQFDSHQGAVLLFETKNGQLLAIMDASEITSIRTAAVSGAATRLLARESAHDLAILGSGVQARTHLEAMLHARRVDRIRVWSRNFDHAQAFAKRESNRHKQSVVPCKTAKEAVREADLICTTTSSPQPVLSGDWISEGAHINAAGAYGAAVRELDTTAVVRSRLFVDRRESTLNESGDFVMPYQEGVIGLDHIRGEIGEILAGQVKGRTSESEITIFKSMGLAIEDLASAAFIYEQAVQKKTGTWIELGGERKQ